MMDKLSELKDKFYDLEEKLELKESELNDIANMGIMLTSILDIDAILSAMMDMSLRIVSAEVGCILLAENDHLTTRISWGVDASLIRKINLEGNIDIAEWTYRTGESLIINEFPDSSEIKEIINSIIGIPISHKSKPIGVLIAVNKTTGEGFSEIDRETLERLVNFAAVAIENAHLMEENLKKQKLEQELSLAKEIQTTLLPNLDIDLKGATVESLYIPAGKVGGDYFDLIPISDKEFIVIVGDVSNKGVPAALMMTAVRSVIRGEAKRSKDVAGIITHVNDIICQDVMKYPDIFISLVYAHYNLKARTCTYTNAGHLPPFLYNMHTGAVRQLTTGGIIIGQFEELEYKAETIDINEGDKFLFFTDGVTECVNIDGEMYGREKTGEFLVSLGDVSPKEFIQKLKFELESFTYGASDTPFDDLTAVLVEIVGDNDD